MNVLMDKHKRFNTDGAIITGPNSENNFSAMNKFKYEEIVW